MAEKFRYTGNVQIGSTDTADIYWRIKWRLEDDPIANMYHQTIIDGLAAAVHSTSVRDGKIAPINRTAMKHYVEKDLLPKTPLGLMAPEARSYMADLVVSALWPIPWSPEN